MKNNIRTKDGFLSAYGFACGYTEKVNTGKLRKEMYKEHNTYHVRSVFNEKGLDIWTSFDTMGPAKKFYKQIK